LACSGGVTIADAVLVSLQSHTEVLETLDRNLAWNWEKTVEENIQDDARIYIASVSPQTRASVAAALRITNSQAEGLIERLLCGEDGIKAGGAKRSGFAWTVDISYAREACLVLTAEEVLSSLKPSQTKSIGNETSEPKKPILASSCPGWICYAEKTHPHILPHLSRLKSPQALMGTMLKTTLAKKLGIPPNRIWHLAIMPCFDKKLEASREELTDLTWTEADGSGRKGVRDVDCVVTTAEIFKLAEFRGIDVINLLLTPSRPFSRPHFPDPVVARFLSIQDQRRKTKGQLPAAATSGGYLYSTMETIKNMHAGSRIEIERGRNADVVEYRLIDEVGKTILKGARYYGFRNIQNLVTRLKPAKASRLPGARAPVVRKKGTADDYAFIEVMACPGGCTNGGGQIKASEVSSLSPQLTSTSALNSREWLVKVDEAYFSADSDDSDLSDVDCQSNQTRVQSMLEHWTNSTGIPLDQLVQTTYRAVESDVGKDKSKDMERVISLAGKIGGGW
jgi:iron only hydrogenase large subunit-like protein